MSFYRYFRQWMFAPEFRIAVPSGVPLDRTALNAIRTLTAAVEENAEKLKNQEKQLSELKSKAESRTASQVPRPESASVDDKLACGLCNDIFRLQRNVKQLATTVGPSRELRVFERVVRNVTATLKDHGVEYQDLTSRPFDERSEDFEPVGRPQEVPGLAQACIAACERPVVLVAGKLVQRARGVVQRPA